jgi:hypothetical protein
MINGSICIQLGEAHCDGSKVCEQGLCDDTLIGGSQVLSMGQVMMQVWMGVIV